MPEEDHRDREVRCTISGSRKSGEVNTMSMAPETLASRLSRMFWKVWEKTYVLIFFAFVGLNILAAYRYGWIAVVRYWGCGFALVGLSVLAWTWRGVRRAEASRGWLPVEARILSSRIEEKRESSSGVQYGGQIIYYYPQVLYEYDVQGLTYQSTRILFVNVNYSHADAEATVARYPAGGKANAFVDPENPRIAVLEPGLEGKKGKYAIAGIVGAVFTAIGAGMWYLTPAVARWMS